MTLVHRQIYADTRLRILTGQFLPLQPIRLPSVINSYTCGRQDALKALTRLKRELFVAQDLKGGYYVRRWSTDEVRYGLRLTARSARSFGGWGRQMTGTLFERLEAVFEKPLDLSTTATAEPAILAFRALLSSMCPCNWHPALAGEPFAYLTSPFLHRFALASLEVGKVAELWDGLRSAVMKGARGEVVDAADAIAISIESMVEAAVHDIELLNSRSSQREVDFDVLPAETQVFLGSDVADQRPRLGTGTPEPPDWLVWLGVRERTDPPDEDWEDNEEAEVVSASPALAAL